MVPLSALSNTELGTMITWCGGKCSRVLPQVIGQHHVENNLDHKTIFEYNCMVPLSVQGALSYAELGTMITRSGGEYSYLHEAFHPVFAYEYAFIQTIMLQPSSFAVISLTCAKYLTQVFFEDGCGSAPTYLVKCLAILVACEYWLLRWDVLSLPLAAEVSYQICNMLKTKLHTRPLGWLKQVG